jgi:hypothetical protein
VPSAMKFLASATNSKRASANSNKCCRCCNHGEGRARLPRQQRFAQCPRGKLRKQRPLLPLLLLPLLRRPNILARSRSPCPIRTSLHPAGCRLILAMKARRSAKTGLKANANEGSGRVASRGCRGHRLGWCACSEGAWPKVIGRLAINAGIAAYSIGAVEKAEPWTTLMPLLTLGQAFAAKIRLIVWCKSCLHRSEPDTAEAVEQHGAAMTVMVWARRLRCAQ